MTPEILHTLVFGWMVALSPPDKGAAVPTYPEATETAEDRTFRYTEISRDIVTAVGGLPTSAQKGAAQMLVAISFHESGWAKDVDLGPCAPRRLKIGGCDHGRAVSIFQVQGHDLEKESREEAARVALRLAFRSMSACRTLPAEERLAVYAGGNCTSKMGRFRSREIWSVVKRVRAMPSKVIPPEG